MDQAQDGDRTGIVSPEGDRTGGPADRLAPSAELEVLDEGLYGYLGLGVPTDYLMEQLRGPVDQL